MPDEPVAEPKGPVPSSKKSCVPRTPPPVGTRRHIFRGGMRLGGSL